MILTYAREVDLKHPPTAEERDLVQEQEQVSAWLDGTLKTVEYSTPGEFFALKYTGAGASALRLLQSRTCFTADKTLEAALHEICKAAAKRGVKPLVDAEHAALQDGVDAWTLDLMRQYNPFDSSAVVYNTYQMYRKTSPGTLINHVTLAHTERWKLGVKLVRGAYIHSDPREFFWDTKAQTDDAYDDALRYLFSTTTTPSLSPSSTFSSSHRPEAKVDLVVACHNRKSSLLARDLRSQKQAGVDQLALAQLMGVADDLSMELIHLNNQSASGNTHGVGVYKYAVWGTTGECVAYLMRRADENKDAVSGGGSGSSGVGFGKVFAEMRRRAGLFSPGSAKHGNAVAQ
jgi:proline dehydrogenase